MTDKPFPLPRMNHAELESIIEELSKTPTGQSHIPDLKGYLASLFSYELTVNSHINGLEARVLIDSLTNAYNRRKFDIDIVKMVRDVDLAYSISTPSLENNYVPRRRIEEEKDLSMMLIDLDHFKLVNDTYGHQKGDQVLILSVEAIKSSLRENDSTTKVYRYGGEEFAVLIPRSNLEIASNIANRILKTIQDTVIIEKGRAVTASIGISNYRNNSSNAEELVRNADRALYRAKDRGRNRVEVYEA